MNLMYRIYWVRECKCKKISQVVTNQHQLFREVGIVVSELKGPICHSNELQRGPFSYEATNIKPTTFFHDVIEIGYIQCNELKIKYINVFLP